MPTVIAKVAVAAATYWLDKPYDYLVPNEFQASLKPGMRVFVPFSRGNRRSEGIVLALSDSSDYEKLKYIDRVLDDEPLLSEEQIKLALFMHDRFYCTVYSAIKAMLPAGLWFDDDGERKVNDRTVQMAKLAIPAEDACALAENKRRKAPQQAGILDLLSSFGVLPVKEILSFTGAARQSLTALVKAELIDVYEREVYRRPEIHLGETVPLPKLTDAQKKAFDGISALSDSGRACAALLFGVTGSGKTTVYIHLIKDRLEHGKSAILLVPEIALTPQMIQTFSTYFGNDVAVLHSSLSAGERCDEWKRIKKGLAHVVIGTRSAVFAPVSDLGIIIIDEEQEETYKSENSPRYHARDVAKFRCAKNECLLLLGSATPDVASRYSAQAGKYSYFTLPGRYNEMSLPQVDIVDMRQELKAGNGGNLSRRLIDELAANIERGEQSILFINRRGTNKLISCGECGYTYKCPRCSVSLTYHSANRRLMCHYCGYSQKLDECCPDCGGVLKYIGAGTQKIEEELHELFPNMPVVRMDTDTVAPAGSHEVLLERFVSEKIPVMVGTQMVTKGLNFENVTLVGVISADQSLYSGSFLAGERTFSLITQVVGRSGRGAKPGRAIIQTYTPENQTILQAANQNYDEFYRSEIEMRKLQNAPPIADLISITASGQDEANVLRCCRDIREMLKAYLRDRPDVRLLGPAPLPVVKVNNRYRYRVNISCRADAKLRAAISRTVIDCSTDKKYKGVSVYADNDPRE